MQYQAEISMHVHTGNLSCHSARFFVLLGRYGTTHTAIKLSPQLSLAMQQLLESLSVTLKGSCQAVGGVLVDSFLNFLRSLSVGTTTRIGCWLGTVHFLVKDIQNVALCLQLRIVRFLCKQPTLFHQCLFVPK